MNHKVLFEYISARQSFSLLQEKFDSAAPFRHIVIDDFLPASFLTSLVMDFPSQPTSDEVFFERGYTGQLKRSINPYSCTLQISSFFEFLNSSTFLGFMERVSGIDGLLPDPYFQGGGLHETLRGGLLGIHTDFRISRKLNLERRLNLILYLNEGWDESFGGNLELWDSSQSGPAVSIAPTFNRCVIFETTDDSFHGHPDPMMCPKEVSRKSFAVYYYTASSRIIEDVQAKSTVYRLRRSNRLNDRIRLLALQAREIAKDFTPPRLMRAFKNPK